MSPTRRPEPEDSDIDELDQELDGEQPVEKSNVFTVRAPLDPPRQVTYSLKDLFHLVHQGNIDLQPPYQRDVVWPDSKQIMLIDSLWRNYHVPPIIFAVVPDDEGQEVRRCVDGKQRLTSIIRFMSGQIPHVDSSTKKRWYFLTPSSKKSLLTIPDKDKKAFEKKQIVCTEYHNISEEIERDIFQRVQLGMSLSSAEKQRAIMSPWTLWFDDLVGRYVNPEDGIPSYIRWNTKRERSFQCIGLLVMVCYYYPNYEGAVPGKLKAFLSSYEEPSPSFRDHIQEVLSILHSLVINAEYKTVIQAKWPVLAPIEFVYIGLLISKAGLHASATLASMIYALRAHTRQKHIDIRMNEVVSRTMFQYIDTEVAQGQEELSDDDDASSQTRRKKRKVRDEEEYRPGRDA